VTGYYFLSESCCLKVGVLSLWCSLSDERTGLQFVVSESQSQSHFSTNSQSVSQSIRLGVKPILELLTRNLSLSGIFIEN
jgi:hypothetical protein